MGFARRGTSDCVTEMQQSMLQVVLDREVTGWFLSDNFHERRSTGRGECWA